MRNLNDILARLANALGYKKPDNFRPHDPEEIMKQEQDALERAFPATNPQRDEWLREMYRTRLDRFLADNNTIWKTGAIFVPVAIGSLIIPFQADIHSVGALVVLTLGSVGLLIIWNLIHENHRAFQDKSMAIIRAIEKVAGFEDPHGPKVNDLDWPSSMIAAQKAARRVYWSLVPIVFVTWLIVIAIQVCTAPKPDPCGGAATPCHVVVQQ